jgi:hypothetical protein
MTGIELIAQERQEQIEKHFFSIENDVNDTKDGNELRRAAVFCLLYPITRDRSWYPLTWSDWFVENIQEKEKRLSEDDFRIEMNRIAGALLAADIDFVNYINSL